MTESQLLLADYVKTGSEAAFRELVERQLNLVYSTASRLVDGDTQLAQEVSQTVFIDLAHDASRMSSEVLLGGWLYRHTCFVAAKMMRGERRRKSRERQAMEMKALDVHAVSDFRQLRPILDEAISELGQEDQNAIVWRFFEQLDFRKVGELLGSNEAAAQKRVGRAVEKLQGILKRRGVSLPVIALATVLGSEAAMAVPAGLATSISACALTSVANGTGAGWAIFKIVTMTKIKIGLIGVIAVAGLVVPLVFQHQGQVQLQEEVKALRQRTAELEAENDLLLKNARQGRSMGVSRAPVFMENTAASLEKRTSEFAQTNVYTRLMTKSPKITAEQAETFLKENNRNASSLLAAFRTTQDPALLQEAMQKFPNDPMVAFEAAFRENSNPGESRQWLEVLKRTAPENALGNYLSALDYFKSGHGDLAVQELLAASGKKQFEDYTQARVQDDEEAYLSAGYSVAEAKTVSSMQLMLPQLQQIKQLGTEMLNMANAYKQSGDDRSAQTTLQMLANLGQRYANLAPGEAEVSQRWGLRWKRWRLIKWSRLPFTERMENRYRTASTSWGSKGKRYESST